MASRFRLRSARAVPGFLIGALRIHRQVRHAPGALGVALIARPLSRTFLPLSAWQDRDSLTALVQANPHRGVMERYRPQTAESTFRFWTTDGADLPVARAEAHRRLAAPDHEQQGARR